MPKTLKLESVEAISMPEYVCLAKLMIKIGLGVNSLLTIPQDATGQV
jgi:hypothetical protein